MITTNNQPIIILKQKIYLVKSTTKQKALIYTCVSTEEQAKDGGSLDAQESLCRTFAEDNSFIVKVSSETKERVFRP